MQTRFYLSFLRLLHLLKVQNYATITEENLLYRNQKQVSVATSNSTHRHRQCMLMMVKFSAETKVEVLHSVKSVQDGFAVLSIFHFP